MNKETNESEGIRTSAPVQALTLQREQGPARDGPIPQQCQLWDQAPGLLILMLSILSTGSHCLSHWAPVNISSSLSTKGLFCFPF